MEKLTPTPRRCLPKIDPKSCITFWNPRRVISVFSRIIFLRSRLKIPRITHLQSNVKEVKRQIWVIFDPIFCWQTCKKKVAVPLLLFLRHTKTFYGAKMEKSGGGPIILESISRIFLVFCHLSY